MLFGHVHQHRALLDTSPAEAAQAAPSAVPSPAGQREVIQGGWIIVATVSVLLYIIGFAILARRFGWRAVLLTWKEWLCCDCLRKKKAGSGSEHSAELVPLSPDEQLASQQNLASTAHSSSASHAPVQQSPVSDTISAPFVQYKASDWMVPAGILSGKDFEEPEPEMTALLRSRPKYKSTDFCNSNADAN